MKVEVGLGCVNGKERNQTVRFYLHSPIKEYQVETVSSEVMEEAILLLENPDLSQEQVGDRLIAQGVNDLVASRLCSFIPEAFGAALTSHMEGNLKFPRTFVSRNKKGQPESVPFASEPVFVHALDRALAMYHGGSKDIFEAIAFRSSAVKVISDAMSRGLKFDSSTIAIAFGIPSEFYQKPKVSLWEKLFRR